MNYSINYSPKQLEVFRISISLFAIISMIGILLDYNLLLSPDGLINWEVNNANLLWFEFNLYKIANYLAIDKGLLTVAIIITYICSLLSLLVGFYTRSAAIVALILFVFILDIGSTYAYGVDIYQSVSLFMLCIFPCGYSLAIKKRKTGINSKQIQQIAIRVLQIYLCLTYANAGIGKALMESWWNGKFIFFVLNDPTYTTTDYFASLPSVYYKLLGALTVIAESLYCIFVWIPVVRTIGIFVIIAMHLFIVLQMGLFSFGLLLVLLNVCGWYPFMISDLKKIKAYAKNL